MKGLEFTRNAFSSASVRIAHQTRIGAELHQATPRQLFNRCVALYGT